MKKVGFVGLGIMGTGMAGQLLQKGFEVTVWNRDKTKAGPLVEQGARLAASPAELAAEVEVVLSMLRDDAVVREVLLGAEGLIAAARPGTYFVDMSTVTPAMARELAAAAKAKGCPFLDAPVLGSKGAAASGGLSILVGGEATDLEAVREVLAAMGQTITHVGPNGTSAVLKLANNQVGAVVLAALGESLALCETSELTMSREAVLDILVGTAGRVSSMKKPKIAERNWETEFALELMHKDLTQTLQAANELNVPMPVLASAREVFQRARHDGKGQLDFSAIADLSEA